MRLTSIVLASVIGALLAAAAPRTALAQIVETPASHAVIMDHATGQILFSKNGDVPMVPASMTKMLTAYVVFELIRRGELSLTDRFTVSEDAWRRGGFPSGTSTMGLAPNDTPTVEELLHGVITMSGNDACIVLAEGISGSEPAFARKMTQMAHEMGLSSVNFVNATGLPGEGHVVSAIDLARLARMTIEDFPEFYDWYALPSYSWRNFTQQNRNPLLEVSGADGLKTGYLSESGYSLTASAVRDGVRRTIVVNGLPTMAARARESDRLMRVAFQSFDLKRLGPESLQLPEVEVYMGAQRRMAVTIAEPLDVVAHRAAFERAQTEIRLSGPPIAPIRQGDRIGDLVITLEGQEPIIAPVLAAEDVARLGFLGRAIEGLRVMMSGSNG